MKRSFLFSTMFAVFALSALAADLSGTWQAQIPGRDGAMMDTTFKFKSEGDKLSGTMENQFGERAISDGKVTGDDVAFNVNIEFGGNQMTFIYKGKVAGNEIKFNRERKGGQGGPANVEFVAKRK